MCLICNDWRLELDSTDDHVRVRDKHVLMNVLRDIKMAHPWHYDIGPLADEIRLWYDLDSERRPHAKK
jgi:hypothetical protein